MNTFKIDIFALFLAISVIQAASIDYRVSFDGVLDNREYGARPAYPLNDETFFFARGAFEAGIAVNDENLIRGGLMPTVWFGAPDTAKIPVNALLYFQHESRFTRFRFGAFPRRSGAGEHNSADVSTFINDGAIESIPVWFFSDESAYRRPYVHGAAVDVGGFRGLNAGAWVDWTGLRDTSVNEAFLFGYGLAYNHGAFFARHDFMMYHFAKTLNPAPGEAVKDNGGASVEIGAARGNITKYIDTAAVSVGAVASLDRDRADMVWHTPVGGFAGGVVGYKLLALRGFYYAGQAQRTAWGGCFYRYSGIESFGRGDVILRFFNKRRGGDGARGTDLNAEIVSSFYFFDGKIGSSQHFILRADIYGAYPK
jgi:hypothetical protein